ncbi:hypothetical protein HQQ81_03460 [Microbacteriaceae bacterium VKM Ac-2854]|nr:hypothetical protein [Microbacteriaceae bacterium VKM Ac-2854]
MTDTTTEIQTLLAEADDLPHSAQERALIDRAIELADEAGDTRLGYAARLRLVAAAEMTGDTDAVLSSFAWCVGMNAQDPVNHPTQLDHYDLLWYYKWIPDTLSGNPIFPRAAIDDSLAQMAQAYRRAGVGMSGVEQARFDEALRSGRLEAAAEILDVVKRTPRDGYSHCEACVRGQEADFLYSAGRADEGLKLFDEIMDEGLACGEEPERAQGSALLPLLRAGRLDDARAMHVASYRTARSNNALLSVVADHWLFCAVTGNEARGHTLIERHLPWLALDALDLTKRLSALIGLAVLAEAIARAGHGELEIAGSEKPAVSAVLGGAAERLTAAQLAGLAWQRAEELGARFDERNGNAASATRIAQARALADEHYDVPLEQTGFSTSAADLVAAEQARAAQEQRPETVEGWVRRAHELHRAERMESAFAAIDAGEQLAETASERALVLEAGLQLLASQPDRSDDIARLIAERGAALREDGRHEQADAEARFGERIFGRATPEDFDELQEARAAATDPALRADLALTAAEMLMSSKRFAEAAELARAAIDDGIRGDASTIVVQAHALFAGALQFGGEPAGARAVLDLLLGGMDGVDRGVRMGALGRRANLSAAEGRFVEAEADAAEALDIAAAIGSRRDTIDGGWLLANILSDQGRFAESVDRARLVVLEAELAERADLNVLRFFLGRELVRAGRPLEASEVLEDVLSAAYQAEEVDSGLVGRIAFWLGHAMNNSDEPAGAYRAWRTAVDACAEAENPSLGGRVGIELGELMARFGDPGAIEILESAVAAARTSELDGLVLDALHALGRVRARFEEAPSLQELDEAIAIAERLGAGWAVADVQATKANLLGGLGRLDEAAALGLQASDGYRRNGDPLSAAYAEWFLAQKLAEHGRHADAVAILQGVLEHEVTTGPLEMTVRLALGDSLEASGRHAEAAQVRAGLPS